LQPSLLQAEQAQLPQPFLIGEILQSPGTYPLNYSLPNAYKLAPYLHSSQERGDAAGEMAAK